MPAPAVGTGPRPAALWHEEPPPHRLVHVMPLFPLVSHSHISENMPCATQWRPSRDVADFWVPVTNQSTPGQAKHICTVPRHTLAASPDTTATRGDLTSSTTRPRWPKAPRQAVLTLGVQAKEQSTAGFKACCCWGYKHSGSVAQRRSHPWYRSDRKAV